MRRSEIKNPLAKMTPETLKSELVRSVRALAGLEDKCHFHAIRKEEAVEAYRYQLGRKDRLEQELASRA